MEVLLLLVMAMANIMCLIVGAKVGQAVSKGEEVKLPAVNPLEAYKTNKERKEAEAEQGKLDTIMHNLENYNGTEVGQQDIPKG